MPGTRRKPGRLGPYVEGFKQSLLASGYTPSCVVIILWQAGRLGRWMDSEDIDAGELDAEVLSAFRAALRVRGVRCVPGARGFRPLLEYLRGEGVLADSAPPCTPVQMLIAEYRTWLVVDRGLAEATVLRYENLAHRFLTERADAHGSEFIAGLSGAHVIAFLLRETARLRVGSAKGRVAELRSLLRFLYVTGRTTLPLATAVPPVAGWRDTSVPVGITPENVQRLLDSCERTGQARTRDFAILLMVSRLGLRSAEVARLELGDIDWRAGQITLRGKARREDRLPLPCDVGEALADYLSTTRPSTPIRQVFLTSTAPARGIRPALVGSVTNHACDRAGLPRVGAHRLRHAMASDLLRHGATLAAVSQVLRHQDLATTAIYAKVDLDALRTVAQPWPGAAR